MDLTLIEAVVMCLTRLQPMLKPVSVFFLQGFFLKHPEMKIKLKPLKTNQILNKYPTI